MRYENIEDLADSREFCDDEFKVRKTAAIHPLIESPRELEYIHQKVADLRIEEMLNAIKDDIWEYASVKPFHYLWDRVNDLPAVGYTLLSDCYPLVRITQDKKGIRAKTSFERTSLSVFVTGRNEEYDRMVHVQDRNLYQLEPRTHTTAQLMEFYGIRAGLLQSFNLKDVKNTDSFVSPEDDVALAQALVTHTENRRQLHCLPPDTIDWIQSAGLLPESENGVLTELDLRMWGYEQRQTPYWLRALDMTFPFITRIYK